MGFSSTVREHALTASARYCCVCHKAKGLNIEVHHIDPEVSGGSNDFDNAIALCFDCHADAGHYNSEHPRGSKFSPRELKLQRDSWHETVKSGNLDPAISNLLHCRYLVCKSFDFIREIAEGELGTLQVPNPLLAQTAANSFLRGILLAHEEKHRREELHGDQFATLDEYLRVHPEVVVQKRSGPFPYFEAVRIPTASELSERVAPTDAITSMLLDANVDPSSVAYALAYREQCGGGSEISEIYHPRPIWALYLAITNLDNTPFRLDSLIYNDDTPNGLGYRPLWARQSQGTSTHTLPRADLLPETTAVIPVATLLGPLWPDRFEELWTDSIYLPGGERRQDLSHGDLSAALPAISVIGPALWPLEVQITKDGKSVKHLVHDFNVESVYVQSRHWMIGSCPHLFFESGSPTSLSYQCELFAKQAGLLQEHLVRVPIGVTGLYVAELEDETTHIELIEVNGNRVLEKANLTQGETIHVEVRAGDTCRLLGRYDTFTARIPRPWRRNEIIADFARRGPKALELTLFRGATLQ